MGRGHRTIKAGNQSALRVGSKAGKKQLILSPVVVKTAEESFLLIQKESENSQDKTINSAFADVSKSDFNSLAPPLKKRMLKGAQIAQDAVTKVSKGKGYQALSASEKEKAAAIVYDNLNKNSHSKRKRSYQALKSSDKTEYLIYIDAVGETASTENNSAEPMANKNQAKDFTMNQDKIILRKLMTSLKQDGCFYIGSEKISGEKAKNYLRVLNKKIQSN